MSKYLWSDLINLLPPLEAPNNLAKNFFRIINFVLGIKINHRNHRIVKNVALLFESFLFVLASDAF